MKKYTTLILAILFLQACEAAKDTKLNPFVKSQDTPVSKSETENCKIKFSSGDSLKKIATKSAQMKEQCHLSETEIKQAAE